jgi:glycosyltransferase involved in cell wall biosynthesis
MKLIVAIATLGRPAVVSRTIAHLAQQTRLPDEVVVSATCAEDTGDLGDLPFPVTLLLSPKGLCAQRNFALKHVVDRADIVTFLDDDFLPGAG